MPGPEDLLLVIEVSDTTLSYDRDVKLLPRYGHSGVPEVWILDLSSRRIEIHSEPTAEGYRPTESFGGDELAHSTTLDLELAVEEVFS